MSEHLPPAQRTRRFLSRRLGRTPSDGVAKEATANIVAFFRLLAEWDAKAAATRPVPSPAYPSGALVPGGGAR